MGLRFHFRIVDYSKKKPYAVMYIAAVGVCQKLSRMPLKGVHHCLRTTAH